MKKKILISLVACFIAAGSFIGYNFAQNNHNMDISLADISAMAQADGENGECPGWDGTPYCSWDDQYLICEVLAECRVMCVGGC